MLRLAVASFSLALLAACAPAPAPVFQTTGIKICEVDSGSAIVWTRLTRNPERVGKEGPMPIVRYRNPETGELEERGRGRRDREVVVEFPDGSTVDTLEGAVPGAAGETRVRFRVEGAPDWRETGWHEVDPESDYTAQIVLSGLEPGSRYEIEVQGRAEPNADVSSTVAGGFKTAPGADQEAPVTFAVTTGTSYGDQDAPEGGYKMYAQMMKIDTDFFVHTGDIVYYDSLGKSQALARWHWHRMYSLPTNVEFHRNTSSYFIKDDHDFYMNDSWPSMETRFMGELTPEQGLAIFREQVGMGGKTYRTVRWGKDLQVWMVEGRDFRSPNDMPDGPAKTIWGKEQFDWLRESMQASDATFRVLISPTPIVGPDRTNKNDNHANAGFTHEGDQVREFLAGLGNAVTVCGDRHWQYVSRDAETGLYEFSSGPGSDAHAGGFSEDQRTDEHVYLNVVGGFMAGTVERIEGEPTLTFRHYSPEGELLNEHRFDPEP